MESFNLLKYWRGGGGAALAAAAATAAASMHSTAAATSTVATCVLDPSAETDDEDGDDGDDGPFFDLEFAVPEEDSEGEEGEGVEEKDGSAVAVEAEADEEEEEREFNFAVSSEGSCGGDGRGLPSDPLSPSDDLFFKGELVPLEPSSIVITSSEADPKPQFAVSLLKSATKLRVFMLGLRKAKSTPAEPNGAPAAPTTATATATEAVATSPKQQSQSQQSRFFVKFKVEEVPIISLFTRDNSSRNSSGSKAAKPQADSTAAPSSAAAEEKKFSKEVVQKYLNKIKPLYIRVSKRYAEKLRFSGQLTAGGAAATNEGEETDAEAEVAEPPPAPSSSSSAAATGTASGVKGQKVNVPAGLKVVCKRLGKSRSASAAVAAVPSPAPQRRDDSLLQQQDGIQSAIAHCKQSFNAAKGSETPLVRSKSDPSDGRSDKSDCV